MADGEGLLDAEFLRELEVLRQKLEIKARSGAHGDVAARRRGSSAEFHEHRAYAPGDDPRRIDWSAFARTGVPVTKLFRAEEDAIVRVLFDASASLDYGTPRKLGAAQRVAAAIGYLALSAGQRAQLIATEPRGLAPASTRLSYIDAERPLAGRVSIGRWLAALGRLEARGTTSLPRAIEHAIGQGRPGMLVVLSDFLDPGDLRGALSRARAAGHDVGLVQVLAPEELLPAFEGDVSLVDAETGDAVSVTMDSSALNAYLERLATLFGELRGWARKNGGSYVRLLSNEPLDAAIRRFVARQID